MRFPSFKIAASLGIVAALAAGAFATASEEALPPADEILDAFVEASGGKDAYDRVDNRVTHGTMEVVGQGISMDLTVYSARPGKTYMVIASDATGKIEKGTDGEVVWESSAMMGPQIKDGQEKVDFLREAILDKFVRWREVYGSAESAGVETVDGSAAYKVILTPKDSRPQSWFFDRASKLLVKVELTVENPMGEFPVETFLSDYREIDGVLIPHLAKVVVMGQQRLMTTENVEQNVDLPEDRFELPDEIRALLEDEPSGPEKEAG
jgi:hypothetical protein